MISGRCFRKDRWKSRWIRVRLRKAEPWESLMGCQTGPLAKSATGALGDCVVADAVAVEPVSHRQIPC